jgi:hypothetical protein
MSAFTIVHWKPILRKSLVAQATVRMPSGVQILLNIMRQKDGQGHWCVPAQIRNQGGGYEPVVTFATKELEKTWQTAVLSACQARIAETEANSTDQGVADYGSF